MTLPVPNPARQVAIVIEMDYALPWHQDCYQGITQYGRNKGWRCVLDLTAAGVHGDPTRTDYHGVIGRIPRDVASRVSGLGVPMVNLTRNVDPEDAERFDDLPGVYIDRPAGVRVAAEHLALIGYPRVGIIAERGYDHEQFLHEVQSVCAAKGIDWVEPFLCPGQVPKAFDEQVDVLRALGRYLDALEKPVGLVVNGSDYARHAVHLCVNYGLRVPEDVGIVARMGSEIMLTSGMPTISSVTYNYFKQGYEAAAMLDRLMNGESVAPKQKRFVPTGVTVRDSTDVFLCDDALVSDAMRYVAAHVREDLNVSRLAEAIGVDRSTLYRRFEGALGRPPQEEINRRRVEYLKRLLSESETPIAEIATQCGFSAASHLTRFFKREAGITPTAYRAGAKSR